MSAAAHGSIAGATSPVTRPLDAPGTVVRPVFEVTMSKQVQGEGNYEAGREYQRRTKRFTEQGDVEGAAEEAKEAIDDEEEGPELERARQETKDVADYEDV